MTTTSPSDSLPTDADAGAIGGAIAIEYTAYAINHAEAGTVVLLGSLGATQEMWEAQVGPLSEFYQVVTVDLRGHGESPYPDTSWTIEDMAADVIAILDELDVAEAHIVGLSLGGAVAQCLAVDYPQRVASLVLSATAAKFGTAQAWQEKAELVREQGTGALADTVVGNWFTQQCFDSTPQLPRRFADMITQTSDAGYAGCCEALAQFDSRPRLADIAAPTLVIAGAEDTSTALPVVSELHDAIPGSTQITISPAKHLLNVEQAELYTAAVLAQLRKVS